jgi:hypothetical protein
MKSIIQTGEKECFLCGARTPSGFWNGLEDHHIFFGANRQKSEKRGLKVWLCGITCHREGKKAAHRCRETDLFLKRHAQEVYEATYGDRADFIREFGKSYL